MKIYFTSDNHFFHTNILDYCHRPFSTVEDMNAAMLERWNETVKPGDLVYHLGDFAMGPVENVGRIRQQLNGRIILLLGNHDRSARAMLEQGIDEVYKTLELDIGGVRVWMQHRPRRSEVPPIYFPTLCGHVHEAWARQGNIVNVGVDVRDFRPVPLEALLATPPAA